MEENKSNRKILIIDDDLSIRFILKKILNGHLKNVEIFSSEDGIQGLGYAYIIKPDVIIIDSTLPKYSGRELIEYLETNDKFANIPIILLNENSELIEDVPSNYLQISKQDEKFPLNLINKTTQLIGNSDSKIKNPNIINFLSRKILRYSNRSNINSTQIKNSRLLKKVFKFISYLIDQLFISFYLTLFYILLGRKDVESSVDQRKKDLLYYRRTIYPAVGFGLAIMLFVCLQVTLSLGAVFSVGWLGNQIVNAASYTWDGEGVTENWSDCDNWSTNVCPLAADNVTFDTTSTKNATIDASWGGTVNSITIASGYTGTISQARSLIISSTFTTSDGTFSAANQTLTITGAFTMNTGSTFTASSATSTFSAGFTINGGTFNHNSGTVSFAGGIATLSCNNIIFNTVNFSGQIGAKTINSNCSLPIGVNPFFGADIILNGTMSGTNTFNIFVSTLTLNTGASLSGFTSLSAGGLVVAGANFDASTYGVFGITSTGVTLNSGTLSLPNFITISGSLTINGGTFNGFTDGNISMSGGLSITGGTVNLNNTQFNFTGGAATLSCNNVALTNVRFVSSTGAKTINNNCNMTLTNNIVANSIILNGTLTGTGTITFSAGTLTMNASTATLSGFSGLVANAVTTTASSSAHLNLGSYTTVDINGAFTINNGTTFTAPSGNGTFASTFNLTSTSTFNHNSGTITFDGSTATITCNSKTFNAVSFTGQTGVKTVSNNCNLPLGAAPTIPNGITLNGTLSGTGTLTNTTGTLTMNASTAILSGFSGLVANIVTTTASSNAHLDLGSYTTVDINGAFTVNNGTTFTAPAGNSTFASTFTLNSTATFNHNNGTITFDGGNGVITCNSKTFNLVSFTGQTPGTKSVNNGCLLPLGNNPIIPNTVALTGGELSGTGTLTHIAGTLALDGATASLSGFSGLIANTVQTFSSSHLNLGSYTTVDINGALTISDSTTFTAPSGNATFAAGFTLSSTATFNHNNGTITFDGSTATLACGSKTFNLVSFTGQTGTKTVNADCSLPLGANPTIPNGITLNGTLSGTGTSTITTGTFTMNASAATLSGFTGLIANAVTTTTSSNAHLNLGSYTIVDINGALIINNGTTFTAPSGNATFANNFTLNTTSTFNHNSGTITFDGESHSDIVCNNKTFNSIALEKTNSGTYTISGGCNLPLGNNPEIGGVSIFVLGTLSGSGIMSVPDGDMQIGKGFGGSSVGDVNGFNSIEANTMSFGGFEATIDLSDIDNISVGRMYIGGLGGDVTVILPSVVDINGDFILDPESGDDIITIIAPSNTMTIFGNIQITYADSIFQHNNGKVILDGVNQIINAPGRTFYDLEKIATSPSILTLNTTSPGIVIANELNLKGTSGNILSIQSSSTGVQSTIDPQGTVNVEYLNVKDNNNIGDVIQAVGKNVTDGGNNIGWNFDNPTISNVGPASNVTGGYITDKTPEFTFDITDSNVSDSVQYQIQIDNNSNFATPEVQYTSDIINQGSQSFQVNSPLNDGEYYVRIKAIDAQEGDGEYTYLNNQNSAFILDTTKPTATVYLSENTATSNPRDIYIISSIVDDGSGVSEMIYSGNSSFNGAAYLPYLNVREYTLPEGTDSITLYFKYKDRAGNESDAYNASINFTTNNTIETESDDIEVIPITDTTTGEVVDGLSILAVRILDKNNKPISNIKIRLRELGIESTTDAEGFALFENVPLGKYSVLGVYEDKLFTQEIDVEENDKVITIKLEESPNNLTIILGGTSLILLIIVAVSMVYIYLNKRKNNLQWGTMQVTEKY